MTTRVYQKTKRNVRRSRRVARDTQALTNTFRSVAGVGSHTAIFA
ncbi:hypothetical protein [Kordiimonas aquimaris]|nr:hypothetical protein [Kordiimonas aquimaris]